MRIPFYQYCHDKPTYKDWNSKTSKKKKKKKEKKNFTFSSQTPWDAVQEPFLIQLLWFVRSVQMVHFRLTKMHECVRRVKGVWVGTT